MSNNSAATANQQDIYSLFHNANLELSMVAQVGVRWLCATSASLSNFSLVYVTKKSKSLRTPCNLLIALDALYTGIYELSVTITFIVVLTGLNFIPLWLCLPFQVLPLLGFFSSQGGMLFIGLDRLISMLFPVWVNKHSHAHRRILVPSMALVSVSYAFIALVLCTNVSLSDKYRNVAVQCGTGDCFPDALGDLLSQNQLILMGITVVCYPMLFGAVMYRGKQGTSGAAVSYTRKIFKSMLAIVLILLAGQSLSAFTRIMGLRPSQATSGLAFLVANGQVCIKYLAYGCNAPILYVFSTEYRKAFEAVILRKEQTTTVQVVQVPRPSNRVGPAEGAFSTQVNAPTSHNNHSV